MPKDNEDSQSFSGSIGSDAVYYLDASVLSRPQRLPLPAIIIGGIIAIVALVAGGAFFLNVSDEILHHDERVSAQIDENLNREIEATIPQIATLLLQSEDELRTMVNDQGCAFYDYMEGDTNNGIDVMIFPPDVTYEDGAEAFADGIANMDATTASLLLNGSWRFTYDTSQGYTDVRIRYADFKATNAEEAIANARALMGWSDEEAEGFSVGEEGTDESGNYYLDGYAVATDGESYEWRISTCSLSELYDISGLPSTAMYVGIRMTA